MALLNIDAAARVLMERVTGGRLDWDRMTEGHRNMYREDVTAVLEAASAPVCTCTELQRGTVCHDMRNEPHVIGCPRWGMRSKGCGECTPDGNGPCLHGCRIGPSRAVDD